MISDALQSIGNWYADLSPVGTLLVLILAAIAVMWAIYLLLGPWDQPYIQKPRKRRDWLWPIQWEMRYCIQRARAHGQHKHKE